MQVLFREKHALHSAVGVNRPYPQRVLIEVWRLSFHHLDSHDAQRPYVHFGTVCFPCDHLGRHPVRGPNHSAALALLRGDLGTETKVGYETKRNKTPN